MSETVAFEKTVKLPELSKMKLDELVMATPSES